MFRAVAYLEDGGDIHGAQRDSWLDANDDLIGFLAGGCCGGTVEQWNEGMRDWFVCELDPNGVC